MLRYFMFLLAVFGLILILIILIIPGGKKNPVPTPKSLTSYASTDAVTQLTIDGPINANQNHQSIEIDVSQNNVIFKQITGYEGQVVNRQTYANNQSAFDVFLHALNYAGFTLGNRDPKLVNEEIGLCALGDRYTYQIIYNGNVIQRFWSTNCGGTRTYGGDDIRTQTLFQQQVPYYANVIQNITL